MPLAVRPQTQVMYIQNVDIPAEAPPAFLERTHDAVVAVVENTFVRLGRDETLPGRAQVGHGRRREDPTDFCRHDDIWRSADFTQKVTEALLAQAEAVMRSGVEVLHAMAERSAQSRHCFRIRNFAVQIPDGPRSEPQASYSRPEWSELIDIRHYFYDISTDF